MDVTIRAQNSQGGWRYNPEPRDADLSMTVMHTVALNSAKEAGISVPDKILEKAVKYVASESDSKTAYSNLMWALINTKEFQYNH